MKRNKFSKALKHLKSKKIDEKIKSLEEAGPTNSMSGVYQVTPSTGDAFRLGVGDPDKKFYPKQDGTWPSGIPADASDTVYVRKGGYYDSGKGVVPHNQTPVARDFSYDDVTANGTTNTDTLIRPSDGKPYTSLPEGTESFILGPLVGNYAINHGYDDFTNIGYIQKDTRQFVLLARIQGFFKGEDRRSGNARTFDGTASMFTSYNSNFKLEHALWMQERYNENDFADNFPFNFSGGVPVERHPSNNAMGMGVIMGILNALFGGNSDNIGTPQDPANVNDTNSLNLMGLLLGLLDKGKDIISKFGDFAMDPFGSIADFLKNDVVDLYDKFSDTALSNDVLEPAFEKFGQILGSKKGALLGLLTTAASDIRAFIGGKYSDFGDKPAFSISNNHFSYAVNLAISLAQSIGNGRPVVMDNSVVSSSTVAKNISVNDINMMFDSNSEIQNGPPNIASDADSILNPNKNGDNKKPYMGDGFGGEGGSIMTPFTDGKGNYFIMNVADKTLRVGGESGEKFDFNTQTFTDIPSGGNATSIVEEMVKSGKFADGLANILNQQGNNYSSQETQNVTDEIINGDTFNNLMTVLDNDTVGGSFVSGYSTGTVNGAAAGSLLYNQIKIKLGLMTETDLQKAGGYGHVSRQTVINVNDLDPKVKAEFFSKYNIKESVVYGTKKRILREIRQPLKEIKELPKTTKLKGYRPNFKGKYSPQNTPDVTASKKSDDIVSGKNASRQVWTAKDKYWKGYETTERMNIIYDNLGHGSQYFDRIVGENVRLKGKKSREVQEHLNMLAHQKAMKEVYGIKEFENFIDESETYDNKINDPLFTKVANRLKKEIDYPKKPSPKGYPDKAPPKIDPNTGMHPKFGKRYKYDKLDPISAKTMAGAPTGDPEIDANVKRQAQKEDWRSDLKNLWLGSERGNWKKKIEEDFVNSTQGMKVGQTFTHVPSGQTVTTGGVLGGIETLQTNVSIFGDEIPGPDASQYGLQGFAKPIDMMRRGSTKKAEQLNKELDSSEDYTKEVKADEFMKARVEFRGRISRSDQNKARPKEDSYYYDRQESGYYTEKLGPMHGSMTDIRELKMNEKLVKENEREHEIYKKNIVIIQEYNKKLENIVKPLLSKLNSGSEKKMKLKEFIRTQAGATDDGTYGVLIRHEGKNTVIYTYNGQNISPVGVGERGQPGMYGQGTMNSDRKLDYPKKIKYEMPKDLQMWQAQAIDSTGAMSREVGNAVAKRLNVKSAFDVLNYYIDNHVMSMAQGDPNFNPNKQHNLTHLITDKTKDILRKGMDELAASGKLDDKGKPLSRDLIVGKVNQYFKKDGVYGDQSLAGQIQKVDIFNSLGNHLGFDVEHYNKTGNYRFNSTYIFTSTLDMGVRMPVVGGVVSLLSGKYVSGQLYGETQMAVQNPMQFQVDIESGRQYVDVINKRGKVTKPADPKPTQKPTPIQTKTASKTVQTVKKMASSNSVGFDRDDLSFKRKKKKS